MLLRKLLAGKGRKVIGLGKEILFSVKAPATSGKERGVSTQWRHFWPSGGEQSWKKVVFKYPC